jgi:tetratricopeptide (TPR) repeat protein
MTEKLIRFFGIKRLQILFALLALTGLGNLILNSVVNETPWARDAQTFLVGVWLFGSIAVIISALDSFERGRWIGILVPAAGAVVLGMMFPNLLGLMLGLAVGWVVAGAFIFRPRSPEEYRQAIRHLRKNEYQEAVNEMTALIKRQPEEAGHYRFRAELYRIWGKLDRARKDYLKMIDLMPDMAIAWNGLAEVDLQAGHYDKARESALKAFELAPREWVTAYNLGMIEDRTQDAQSAVGHLQQALDAKVPDVRHRLLIYLYLARAYARLGDSSSANDALTQLKKHENGLTEWNAILKSEQAETLRQVIQADIHTIEQIINDGLTVEALV